MTARFLGATCCALFVLLAFPAIADEERGKQLYELCQMCHGDNGEGMTLSLAPSIAGQSQWYVESQLRQFRDGGRGVHPEDVPGMRMRPMSIWLAKDEDLVAVAEYVSNLPPVALEPTLADADVEKGKTIYVLCQACHGPEGEGMEPLKAPKLTHVSDWYLVSQLKRFKEGVRGTNPKNPNSALMRPMAMSLADEQAMKDVSAYIMTLSK